MMAGCQRYLMSRDKFSLIEEFEHQALKKV